MAAAASRPGASAPHAGGVLARAVDGEWPKGLLGWLPYQDWRPVVAASARRSSAAYLLDELRKEAQARGMDRLACDLDNVVGRLCGETLSAE